MVWTKGSAITPATISVLGGVKVGTGLSVTGDGTLSVNGGGGGTTSDWNNKAMNCLGDSITANLPQYSTSNYHVTTKQLLGLSIVNNYGVGGTCITAANDSDTSFVNRYVDMDSDADLITVLGGVNDMTQNKAMGTPSDAVKTTFYGALNILMAGLIAMYPAKTIVFMTPVKFNNVSGDKNRVNTAGFKLIDYVNAIKDRAQYYSIPVLDLYSTTFDPTITAHNTLYFTDGLHPNATGHAIMGKRLAKFLNTL